MKNKAVPQQSKRDAEKELDLHHTKIDLDRQRRNGFAEIIYGEGKTASQLSDIFIQMRQVSNVLATRVEEKTAQAVLKQIPDIEYHKTARILRSLDRPIHYHSGTVGIITAGTSDCAIAEEVRLTCEILGCRTQLFYDVGVAGIHRLLSRIEDIQTMQTAIVIAGMEGALASVVGGLVAMPVIAVPTSIGYGANFSGLSALLGMLTSCAAGVTVVNIDNGVGAACAAYRICAAIDNTNSADSAACE